MSVVNTAYKAANYYTAAQNSANTSPLASSSLSSDAGKSDLATTVTLSQAAQAALEEKDFTTVVAEARAKLRGLLSEAKRQSPLEDGKLALDLASLDHRELYAISSNSEDLFTPDEQEAASLEMQRRFEAAMAGPAAVAEVTGSWLGLYKAAAAYLDGLGPEEKSEDDWKSARAALTQAIKQLSADPKTLPAIEDDPVALYLALREAEETVPPRDFGDVADDARNALDELYGEAIAGGRAPTFNKNTTIGAYIDLSAFDSRMLSAITLNEGGKFSSEEVRAAEGGLRARSGAALNAAFQNAARAGTPTAFSHNIISLYAAMTPEERQASGWSEAFYQTAVASYEQTNKLMDMLASATGGASGSANWFRSVTSL
ncbi:hypothetical protein [Devosia nitrariae]|uniref:DUF1217 domain-containing protein n=1 Tax=Devosia nitrariae TaxID=2071872 RepID=A0ABQ5VYW8_9HYPH|nr:hypothetical protein [Devosia nitrariae]GLQ52830.1 hypothetical protein GCM10010862_00880 [Devosia nitrariae]